MNNPTRFLVSTMVLFLLAGCSQSGPQAIPIKAANRYAAKVQSDGLAAGAEPFDTYLKSTNALGSNVSREFTPVQLVVESAAPDKFLLQRDSAKLICADGTRLEPVSALTMFERYRETVTVSPLIGFAGAAAMVAGTNERTKSDWMNKEFPAEAVLKSGGRTGGLLYFRGTCPDRMGRRLQMTADKLTSSEVVTLSIELR